MKTITKSKEPKCLTEHKAPPFTSYENLKEECSYVVRESLIDEQGYICCYCMQRIYMHEKGTTPITKIEHFLCQADYPDKDLDYKNMLLACMGGEGAPKRLQICDTRKRNAILSISPTNTSRNIEDLIKYKPNGEIYSTDNTLNEELESVLNLNLPRLVKNREAMYLEVQSRIRIEGKKQGNKVLQKKFLEDEKAKLLKMKNGKFKEYCMVGVYVINKKLRKIANQ